MTPTAIARVAEEIGAREHKELRGTSCDFDGEARSWCWRHERQWESAERLVRWRERRG